MQSFCVLISVGYNPGAELPGEKITLCLEFGRTAIVLSKAADPSHASASAA